MVMLMIIITVGRHLPPSPLPHTPPWRGRRPQPNANMVLLNLLLKNKIVFVYLLSFV